MYLCSESRLLFSLPDIDECKDTKNPVCDQLCFDNVGSYKCSCQAGYELESDMRSCKVSGSKY